MPLSIYAYIIGYFAACYFIDGGDVGASTVTDDFSAISPFSQSQVSYQDYVKEVGFDIRDVEKNAQLNKQPIKLGMGADHVFMRTASDLKKRLKTEGKTVHPLSLFLGAAMRVGNSELIGFGSRVLNSYAKDNQFIANIFGWR